MRANSDRTGALAFGAIAETYDLGRITFESSTFHEVVEPILGNGGRRVLEIGAGTGLLTEALEATNLDLDLLVTRATDCRTRTESRSRRRGSVSLCMNSARPSC